MFPMKKLTAFAGLGLGIAVVTALLAGCTTVPETGRHQLSLISSGQEMQLGLTSFDKLKQDTPISRDPAANALLQTVGKRIAAVAAADLPNAQWEFVVFESKEANAFCLPGGKVGVYTGILPITQNEAGLATVLGHETAHATSHHGAERMSEELILQGGSQLVGAGFSAANPTVQAVAAQAYGLGANLGRELPHSRKQESEADAIGLIFMARAGYNPEEAIHFWERFSAYTKTAGGASTPWFLRTHPLDDKRIAALKLELPKAMAEYNRVQGAGGSSPR